jgi:hypothetical protein
MNEAPFPTQAAVSRSFPPPPARPPLLPRFSRLRASLAACTGEGLAAEAVSACFGNAVVTAWGIELGASPVVLGALWGLPYFGQVFQLPGAWVTARFGAKRTSVVANAIARQVLLPLAALPFVDVGAAAKRAMLIALFALSSLLATVGNNAWLAWMGELVPARVRGRYFARRAALCTVAATVASFAIASALDAGRAHRALGFVLAASVLARSAFGVAATALMSRQHESPQAVPSPQLGELRLPFAHPVYRELLVYRAAWGLATGLAASVSAVYLIEGLGLGFLGVAGYGALVAALRVATASLWGRTLDRAGPGRVLVACSFGAAGASALWIGGIGGRPWLIALDAVLSGVLLGGQELAAFTLPLSGAPPAKRHLFIAWSMAIGGVAYGLACAAGGALASCTSTRAVVVASVGARLLAATTALRIPDGDTAPLRASPARAVQRLGDESPG